MKTVKKFKTGWMKGWNIRQTKDGLFHAFKGTVWQYGNFKTIEECEERINN